MNKTNEKVKEIAKEKNNKKSNSSFSLKRLTLGGVILLMFGLLYVPSLINWLSGNNITVDIIRNGIIEESVSAKGIIVRNEELLEPSAFEGKLIPEIAEGEKTAAYSTIASVMNDKSDLLLKEVDKINAKIVKSRMEKAEKADFFSEDIVKLDGEIGRNVQNLITACNNRSFTDLKLYRNEITKIVEKKAEILGDDATDSYIASLNKEKEELQNKISMNRDRITSSVSGIVSYAIDGYEGILTPQSISSLSLEEIERMQKEYINRDQSINRAYAGKPVAKIIKGTDIQIVAIIDEKDLKNFEKEKRITVRIDDSDFEASATVAEISPTQEGRALVTVKVSRGVDTLSDVRHVNVDFISKTQEGLKVPLKCLMDISPDGTAAKIMLVKYNVSTLREVEILSQDNEYAIITTEEKNVNLYDSYIINPENVEEGVIVNR